MAVASTTVSSSTICSVALRLKALRTALFSPWLVRQLTLQDIQKRVTASSAAEEPAARKEAWLQ
jgi:hypothetical protein